MDVSSDALGAARRRLQEELVEVERELEDLGSDPDGTVRVVFDEGFADAAQTTSERAKVLSLIETLRQRLQDLRAAQLRIERGTYGRCERCGQEIGPERLDAIPAVRLCISCAQRR
ncbi:MAG: TraR/DksA family transcriptional regulator [Actinomycetota bacterium]